MKQTPSRGDRRPGYSAARSGRSGRSGFKDTEAALPHPPPTSLGEFPDELGRRLEVLRAQPH